MTIETYKKIEEARNLYQAGKINDALKIFKELLQKEKDADIYYYMSKLILDDDRNEALKIVNEGLREDANNFNLLRLKAEIVGLYFTDLPTATLIEYLNEAFGLINKAEYQFNNLTKDRKREIVDIHFASDPEDTMEVFYAIRAEIKSVRSNIVNLRNSVIVLSRVEDSEQRLFKERIRIIELLGLFVAIFAFIISSVQIIAHYELVNAIILIAAMGLALMAFMLALHLAITPGERTKPLFLLLLILVITLFLLPLVPNIISGIKFYLHLQ